MRVCDTHSVARTYRCGSEGEKREGARAREREVEREQERSSQEGDEESKCETRSDMKRERGRGAGRWVRDVIHVFCVCSVGTSSGTFVQLLTF